MNFQLVKLRSNVEITIETEETGKKKLNVNSDNTVKRKVLRIVIENLLKGQLVKYFNKWKYPLPEEEVEKIIKNNKKTIIKRTKINLKKKKKNLKMKKKK